MPSGRSFLAYTRAHFDIEYEIHQLISKKSRKKIHSQAILANTILVKTMHWIAMLANTANLQILLANTA